MTVMWLELVPTLKTEREVAAKKKKGQSPAFLSLICLLIQMRLEFK